MEEVQRVETSDKGTGESAAPTGAYASADRLISAVRRGDVALLRSSWLMARAGYARELVSIDVKDRSGKSVGVKQVRQWVARGPSVPLPCRQALEAEDLVSEQQCAVNGSEHKSAFLDADELTALLQSFRKRTEHLDTTSELVAAPVFAVSHCWEKKENPDPEGRTLRAVAKALAGDWKQDVPTAGLPLYEDWGFSEIGVFFDWSSLYQSKPEPRTPLQDEIFCRALGSMEMWYANGLVTVGIVQGQGDHIHLPRDDRGWPFFEHCVTCLFKSAPRHEGFFLEAGAREMWLMVVAIDAGCGGDDASTRVLWGPPLAPSRFATELNKRTFTNKSDEATVVNLYTTTMVNGFSELRALTYAKLDWVDADVEELGTPLNEVHCPHLTSLDLSWQQRITSIAGLETAITGGALAKLTHLSLRMCTDLLSLPESLHGLARLQTADLSGCVELRRLPESIVLLSNLEELLLDSCSSLEALPQALGEIDNLQKLDVTACVALRSLPDLADIFLLEVINLPVTLTGWEQGGRRAFRLGESE